MSFLLNKSMCLFLNSTYMLFSLVRLLMNKELIFICGCVEGSKVLYEGALLLRSVECALHSWEHQLSIIASVSEYLTALFYRETSF